MNDLYSPENIKQAFRELMQEPEFKDWIRQEISTDPVIQKAIASRNGTTP